MHYTARHGVAGRQGRDGDWNENENGESLVVIQKSRLAESNSGEKKKRGATRQDEVIGQQLTIPLHISENSFSPPTDILQLRSCSCGFQATCSKTSSSKWSTLHRLTLGSKSQRTRSPRETNLTQSWRKPDHTSRREKARVAPSGRSSHSEERPKSPTSPISSPRDGGEISSPDTRKVPNTLQ